ncbi:uncharacterized protein LOC119835529 [Zerene cesonia]|uniref:uncharacterized protein LOC119835529 n=1 Tax=Zerene cesonia TaxID=33412 RepID=UPI0018E59770|nr:uncharacterized protein LOC119835529 [Zerene cesonia]XP_038216346.1 uncharacterized protein LOC119835529 [Zerene cesonia]
MRWLSWWHILLALHAQSFASGQTITPTICEDGACRCDSFTRVICSCINDFKEVTLRPDGAYRVPAMATGIVVDGCASVIFLQDTVRNLIQLRSVELRNVGHIVISERALNWSPYSRDSEMNPGIRITIQNSTISEIASHAIQGRVNEVLISDSRIDNLRPFAFSSLVGVKNVELQNNVFNNIDIQTFKKFTTSNFIIRGGLMHRLPSRFLSDVEVTNLFRLDGVNIKYLSSLTFLVQSPKRIIIENNDIDVIEGDSFHMVSRGPITFRNNTVLTLRKGAFLGLTVDSEIFAVMARQELLIDNNTITNLSPPSLLFNHTTLTLRVDGLNLNATCTCELAEEWREVYNTQGSIINCWYDLEGYYISLPTFVSIRCGRFKQNFWIFVLVGILVVLLASAIAIFFIVKRDNEKKKKLQIVLPDGKTYRETEFHVIVERAELLTTDL